MGSVAVIGESIRADGFGLAGALVFAAETAAEALVAWHRLPSDVVTVIFTPDAADAVGQLRFGDGAPYSVVLPL